MVICGVLEAAKHGQADADLSGKGSTGTCCWGSYDTWGSSIQAQPAGMVEA